MTDAELSTCPACRQPVRVPQDGQWVRCPACGRGRLRWRPDPANVLASVLAEQLRADLAELEGWAAEGIRGAAELVASVQARLRRIG